MGKKLVSGQLVGGNLATNLVAHEDQLDELSDWDAVHKYNLLRTVFPEETWVSHWKQTWEEKRCTNILLISLLRKFQKKQGNMPRPHYNHLSVHQKWLMMFLGPLPSMLKVARINCFWSQNFERARARLARRSLGPHPSKLELWVGCLGLVGAWSANPFRKVSAQHTIC